MRKKNAHEARCEQWHLMKDLIRELDRNHWLCEFGLSWVDAIIRDKTGTNLELNWNSLSFDQLYLHFPTVELDFVAQRLRICRQIAIVTPSNTHILIN